MTDFEYYLLKFIHIIVLRYVLQRILVRRKDVDEIMEEIEESYAKSKRRKEELYPL